MVKKYMIILFLFFTFVGCYTIMKHPEVEYEDNPDFVHVIYFTDNCMDCHTQQDMALAPMQRPYLPRLDYIHRNERWSYYYEYPWWNREYFSGYAGGGTASSQNGGALPTTSSRGRFPGAGSGGINTSPGSVSSGGASGTSITGSGSSTGGSSQGTVRQGSSSNDSGARSAIRGSGSNSNTKSSDRKTVKRRKKK